MRGPAHISERLDAPGSWGVEFIDEDGSCKLTIFDGPRAKERAIEYGDGTYGGSTVFILCWVKIDGRDFFKGVPESK